MPAIAAAGSGFLVAVLWFDLMFDVQVRQRGGDTLPGEILVSISAYYRRVTIEAMPMNRLVSVVMALTVLAIIAEIVAGAKPWWLSWTSLAVSLSAMGLAGARIIPNAKRLGRATDSLDVQTRLARSVYREHLYCFAAMCTVLALQLVAAQN
jgi:hypothetical protein